MDNLSNILGQYTLSNSEVEIIEETSKILTADIPQFWKKIFLSDDFKERKSILLTEWKKFVSVELSNTISYLDEYLLRLDLIFYNGEYSILYTISSYDNKDVLLYEGKKPVSVDELRKKFGDLFVLLDSSIVNFYTNIHNGFYDYRSKSMGLDPVKNIEPVSLYEWEYIKQIDFNLEALFTFFSNGMGDYIVLDIDSKLENGAYLWSKMDLPERGLNFWNYIDEWTVIGFE